MSSGSVERVVYEYTLHRRRASVLLYLVVAARRAGRGAEAERVYREWMEERLGFREALEALERLAGERIDEETRKTLIEGRLPPDDSE